VLARRGPRVAFVENQEIHTWKGYAMALAMFLASVGHTTLYQNGMQQSSRVGVRVRAAIIDVVFRKSLVLAPSAAVNAGGGDIVNLLGRRLGAHSGGAPLPLRRVGSRRSPSPSVPFAAYLYYLNVRVQYSTLAQYSKQFSSEV